MKLLNKFKTGFAATAISLIAYAMFASPIANAIPYAGVNTTPAPSPAFNVYTGVPSEGNEADFFRGKVEGDTNASVNDVRSSCATGTRFTLRVYVHNGASDNLNGTGNGPSVAKNTKVKVDLKNASAKTAFAPEATISASNAATVNDGMTITCTDGKTVNLNYVTGTAKQFSRTGTKALSDSIVTTGAPVGTDAPDGNVWGCWEQRVYVTLTVEVKEQPKPVIGDGVCKVNDVVVLNQDKRNVRATVNGVTTGQGASIVGYEINWGDESTVSSKQTDTHTYTKDGTYRIVGRVQVKFADGTKKWVTSVDCTRTVKFEAGKPPVIPPVTPPTTTTTLPAAGAGSMFGIFAGTSALAAGAHQIVTRRRASRIK